MELKQTMTFEEMERYMKEKTFIVPSKVSVGRFARKMGYTVYKPMIEGRLMHLYVNPQVSK